MKNSPRGWPTCTRFALYDPDENGSWVYSERT